MKIALLLALLSANTFAKNYLDENVKKFDWNGIEVVWLEDDSLPTYDVIFYFGSGALDDGKDKRGLTELTLSEITSGTPKFSQSQLVESLEFFGTSYGSQVTHEFSSFAVSGLNKNFHPALKLVCHVFNEAQFPKNEIEKSKRRILSSMKNMISNHGALADHVFRIESMKDSGYDYPTTGFMKSIGKLKSADLQKRLEDLNEKTYKRIYMRGDKTLKDLEKIVQNDCNWKQGEKSTTLPEVKKTVGHKVFLVPVPNANQAQVRVGRIMTSKEVGTDDHVLKSFSGKFLGGGFSGRLIQELRVKRGLTYSAGAFVAEQKQYGRIGISTFTKNETLLPLLNAINDVVIENSTSVDKKTFTLSTNNAKGNFLLGLESSSDFLKNLMYFDHIGRSYDEIYEYSSDIDAITPEKLANEIKTNFNLQEQVIVIVGDKSLAKDLKAAGYKAQILDYKDYL